VRSLIPAGVAAVISVGSVVLVGAFLPWAGVTLALCLVVAALVSPWLSARSARLVEARGAQVRAEMTSATLEILESAGPLAVSGRLPVQSQALRAADRGLAKVTDDGARSSALAAGLLVAAVGVAALASLLLGIPAVEAGTLAPVELSVIVLTPLAVFEAAGVLPAAAVQWHRSSQAAQRVLDLLDPVAGPQSPANSPAEPLSGPADTAAGPGLQLTDASCAWPTSPAPVVAAIDIKVPAGRSVAVVGPSGVGKTTLLMTAAGLLPLVSGTVTLDGTAPSDLDPQGARRTVFVAEDGHVFDTTILENLRVARGDLTEHEAVAALTEVGLNEWLDTLPDGVETLLGADATTISGGERRRLLIARALLAPAGYLLVDEPAEHLDGPTADTLVRLLARDAREHGRGVLIATHRLSALDAVDEVIVLARPQAPEAGPGIAEADTAARIVARGTHAELMLTPAYRWALDQETV
jgi:ATP-binding cassette subfamily C protein CydC